MKRVLFFLIFTSSSLLFGMDSKQQTYDEWKTTLEGTKFLTRLAIAKQVEKKLTALPEDAFRNSLASCVQNCLTFAEMVKKHGPQSGLQLFNKIYEKKGGLELRLESLKTQHSDS